jgi:hypothetical protein
MINSSRQARQKNNVINHTYTTALREEDKCNVAQMRRRVETVNE